MNPAYPVVSERAEHRCEYCRAPELVFNFPFEVEHIVPVCRGGANTDANLALSIARLTRRQALHDHMNARVRLQQASGEGFETGESK